MKIAICDDDMKIRENISNLLKVSFDEQDIDWIEPDLYENGDKLFMALTQKKRYDLIYLDIEMPGRSGMEIAAEIRRLNGQVQIIFITSHAKYVYDAFRVMPVDFLPKPIKCDRFKEAFVRALDNYRWQHQMITCQVKDDIIVLQVKDILYLSSEGKWITFHMKGGITHKIRKTMTEMEKQMKLYYIMRCYRSYLVNLAYVKEISARERLHIGVRNDGMDVLVIDPTNPNDPIRLPVGDKYFYDFQAALVRYQEEGRQIY